MKLNILAYSSDPEFMGALSSWFDQREFYTLRPVSSLEEVPETLTGGIFDAVILDAAEGDVPVTLLTCDLVEQQPGIKVLLYPPQNDPNHPDIKDVIAHRFLSKPFSADDLTTALNELFAPPPLPIMDTTETGPGETETTQVLTSNSSLMSDSEESAPADQAAPPTDEDIGFLKEWITEEPHEEPSPETEIKPLPVPPQTERGTEHLVSVGSEEIKTPIPGENSEADKTDVDQVAHIGLIESATEPAVHSVQSVEEQTGTTPMVMYGLRLSYNCVLLPRHLQQYLVRDLADRLGFILPQIHLSRGWRVTGISVRPLYLQWYITLPIDTDPVEAINEIRHRTSVHLYTNFPELKPHDSDQDFWAPGYLMMSGTQPMPPSVIQVFIDRTRTLQQQGR